MLIAALGQVEVAVQERGGRSEGVEPLGDGHRPAWPPASATSPPTTSSTSVVWPSAGHRPGPPGDERDALLSPLAGRDAVGRCGDGLGELPAEREG